MNRIWIFICGEPHEIDGDNIRLHRAVKISKYLSEKKNKKVTVFSSTFDHVKKVNRFNNDKIITISDNLKIHFLKTIPYKKNISIMRLISNFFLGIRLYFYLKKQKEKPDIILSGFPPIETSLACILYAKINKIKTIIDVRDLWPIIFIENYSPKLKKILKYFLFPFKIMTNYVFNNTTSLISISSRMLNWSQNYTSRKNTTNDDYIPFSYIDSSNIQIKKTEKIQKLEKVILNKFNITLIGNVTTTLQFQTIYDSLSILKKYPDIQFIICGAGDYLEETKEKCKNFDNIIFTGWINQDEIRFILRNSKLGIIPYRNDINLSTAMPNKFSEYLSFGLPIITCLIGSVSEIIEKEKIGIIYQNLKYKDLITKLLNLYNNRELLEKYSFNSRKLFLNKFEEKDNHEKIYNHIKKVYNSK